MAEKLSINTSAHVARLSIVHGDGTVEDNVTQERYLEYRNGLLEMLPSEVTVDQVGIRQSTSGNGRTSASVRHEDFEGVHMTRISTSAYVVGEGEARVEVGKTHERITQIAADFAQEKAGKSERPSFLGRVADKLLGGLITRMSSSDLEEGDPRHARALRIAQQIDKDRNDALLNIQGNIRTRAPSARVTGVDDNYHAVEEYVRESIREEITERARSLELIRRDSNEGTETRMFFRDQVERDRFLLEESWGSRAPNVDGDINRFAARDYDLITTQDGQITNIQWSSDERDAPSNVWDVGSSGDSTNNDDVPYGTICLR